jgi:hypothetical protein
MFSHCWCSHFPLQSLRLLCHKSPEQKESKHVCGLCSQHPTPNPQVSLSERPLTQKHFCKMACCWQFLTFRRTGIIELHLESVRIMLTQTSTDEQCYHACTWQNSFVWPFQDSRVLLILRSSKYKREITG